MEFSRTLFPPLDLASLLLHPLTLIAAVAALIVCTVQLVRKWKILSVARKLILIAILLLCLLYLAFLVLVVIDFGEEAV